MNADAVDGDSVKSGVQPFNVYAINDSDVGKTLLTHADLTPIMQADTNGYITFVIIRAGTEGGVNSSFASKESTTLNPPRLATIAQVLDMSESNPPLAAYNEDLETEAVHKVGDNPQGVLESEAFTVSAEGSITVDAAGAGGRIELVDASSGAVLESIVPNSESVTMSQFQMDVSSHSGTSVKLRIVDDQSGSWGHIAVDNIHIAGNEILWDFENGNLSDTTGTNTFTASGTSPLFGQVIPYNTSSGIVDSVNPGGGKYHVRTDFYGYNPGQYTGDAAVASRRRPSRRLRAKCDLQRHPR